MTIVTAPKVTIQTEIPQVYWRYLDSQEEKVLEVVLVYNGADRKDTIIHPEGMRTDPSVVTINYNHKGVSTGAYLTNCRTEKDYHVEGMNGKTQVIESCLVGEIHIPTTAEMFYFDKEGQKRSNGNLYEAVQKGHIRSVSVGFRPLKQSTNIRTGITTFETWDLLELSLLDVTPGQPMSGIKVLRMFETVDETETNTNTNHMSTDTETSKKEKVTTPEPKKTTEETKTEVEQVTERKDLVTEEENQPEADSEGETKQEEQDEQDSLDAVTARLDALDGKISQLIDLLTNREDTSNNSTESTKPVEANKENAVDVTKAERSLEETQPETDGSMDRKPANEPEKPAMTPDEYHRLLSAQKYQTNK